MTRSRTPLSPATLVSLILKLTVVAFAVAGTMLSIFSGKEAFMGGTRVLMYFTIQSNLALALICLIGGVLLLTGKQIPHAWYVIKYVGTLSITLTGAVFCFVLAPTMGSAAWVPANLFTHVIVPVASILDFFLTCIHAKLSRKHALLVTLPPLLYAIYAGIGYAAGWEFATGINYPYFFLNWGSPAGAFGFSSELPFMGCGWWILLLFVLLVAVGLLYLAVLGGIRKFAARKTERKQV